MRLLLLVCVIGAACSLSRKQLNGLQRLLTKLDGGIYPTCDLILFSELVDYDTADKRCQHFQMGTATPQKGNLATVNDAEKNSNLQMLLNMAYPIAEGDKDKWGPDKWVWAGLRKVRNNGYDGKVSRKYNPLDWSWADGSHPTTFKKWFSRRQPDQAALRKGKRGCNESPKCMQNQMRINHHGKWDDTFKFKKHPYACDYQGKYILSANRKTWPKAKEACESAGLHLAKVRNEGELEEIKQAALFFLGPMNDTLRIFHADNWFWVGGTDTKEEGIWRWSVDGEEIDTDWMPWRPPNTDNAEFIGDVGQDVMSISKWGQFDDSYDTKRKRAFACQCPGT